MLEIFLEKQTFDLCYLFFNHYLCHYINNINQKLCLITNLLDLIDNKQLSIIIWRDYITLHSLNDALNKDIII